MLKSCLSTVAEIAVVFGTMWVMEQLHDPISPLRLRLEELRDHGRDIASQARHTMTYANACAQVLHEAELITQEGSLA